MDLVDGHGRVVRDLRLSVTDRCDLRCAYCMPAEGLPWLPREDLLTYEELARIARVAVERFGFDGIRVTGGEPLVRARLERLVEMLAPLGVDLALTTNGIKLADHAASLAAAGLGRVTVSLDTLDATTFRELTRRDGLDRVLLGIDAALAAGLPVKVNAVVIRGVNEFEVTDLAAFGRARGVGVRFIEFMPLDADGAWSRDAVVPAAEIRDRIDAVFPIRAERVSDASEPARRYRYADGIGDVGFIASVTEPFCGDCDRMRLTADGKLRACLFALEETDVRSVLRGGGSDDDLAGVLTGVAAGKWLGHHIGAVDFIAPERSMSRIGG
jgi:cyclic pyranopterin phosphate synthase